MKAAIDQSGELYCLFAPIEDELLVLPDVAVIESMSMQMIKLQSGEPAWLLGELLWQGRAVPVVSFEGLCGRAIPVRNRRSRVMIVNGPGRYLDTGLFAVLTQGHPQLIGVHSRAVKPASLLPRDVNELVLARISLGNRQPLIPDLEAIEASISDALGRRGGGRMVSEREPFQSRVDA